MADETGQLESCVKGATTDSAARVSRIAPKPALGDLKPGLAPVLFTNSRDVLLVTAAGDVLPASHPLTSATKDLHATPFYDQERADSVLPARRKDILRALQAGADPCAYFVGCTRETTLSELQVLARGWSEVATAGTVAAFVKFLLTDLVKLRLSAVGTSLWTLAISKDDVELVQSLAQGLTTDQINAWTVSMELAVQEPAGPLQSSSRVTLKAEKMLYLSTPLELAVAHCSWQVVELLLSASCKLRVDATAYQCRIEGDVTVKPMLHSLSASAEMRRAAVDAEKAAGTVTALVAAGADPNAIDSTGRTVLSHLIRQPLNMPESATFPVRLAQMKALLASGARPNDRNAAPLLPKTVLEMLASGARAVHVRGSRSSSNLLPV